VTSKGKIMLGFLVRRCANAIGHEPSAEEFAAWANTYREHPQERARYLFGRPITVFEAEVIMRHPGREVSTRLAPPANPAPESVSREAGRVIPLMKARPRASQLD
jgi:hypothetical protein